MHALLETQLALTGCCFIATRSRSHSWHQQGTAVRKAASRFISLSAPDLELSTELKCQSTDRGWGARVDTGTRQAGFSDRNSAAVCVVKLLDGC